MQNAKRTAAGIACGFVIAMLIWVFCAPDRVQAAAPFTGDLMVATARRPAADAPRAGTSEDNKVSRISFDFDSPPDTKITIAPHLTFGAQIELDFKLERNFDMQADRDDELAETVPQLTLAFSYDPNQSLRAFLEIELSTEFINDEQDRVEEDTRLTLDQFFVVFREIVPDASLQLGRQEFKDEREWLYDADLDAIRLFYRRGAAALELSASRENLVDKDLLNPEDNENINNYIGLARYAYQAESQLATYVIWRDDQTQARESPLFMGLRGMGTLTDNLTYWLELAYVAGADGSDDIRGYGLDLGLTYQWDLALKPAITVAFAYGSGDDDPDDDIDASFRQTGFEDNAGKFNGVVDFQYYGEVLDPELSNILIYTVGIGIQPLDRNSIDLVFHYYRQDVARDNIRGTPLDRDPAGKNKDLGIAVDLITGLRLSKPDIKFELALGYFDPQDAFADDADSAFFTEFSIEYEF